MTPARPDAGARREEILAAALRVFAYAGYAGATLKDIATAAGLGSAAHLYYYFPKKTDLFAAVLVRYLRLDPMLEDGEADLPVPVVLETWFRRYLAQLSDPERQLAFYLVGIEGGRLLTLGVDLSEVDLPGVHRDLEAYLVRQAEAGHLRSDVEPGHVASAALGIVNFHIQNRSVPVITPVTSDDDVVRNAVEIILHGVVP